MCMEILSANCSLNVTSPSLLHTNATYAFPSVTPSLISPPSPAKSTPACVVGSFRCTCPLPVVCPVCLCAAATLHGIVLPLYLTRAPLCRRRRSVHSETWGSSKVIFALREEGFGSEWSVCSGGQTMSCSRIASQFDAIF